MANDKVGNLALYLIGLALLESNGETYVRQEIRETIKELEKELKQRK